LGQLEFDKLGLSVDSLFGKADLAF